MIAGRIRQFNHQKGIFNAYVLCQSNMNKSIHAKIVSGEFVTHTLPSGQKVTKKAGDYIFFHINNLKRCDI